VKALLIKAEEHNKSLYPLLLCAVRAGLRMGELIDLQCGDVDLRGRFIEVRRSVVLCQEATTKSHKIRRVEMSQQLHDTLKRMKEIRQLEAMSNSSDMLPWVFLSPQHHRWDDRNLRRAWYQLLEKAELRQVRVHDLRHTYVSLLIEQGGTSQIHSRAGWA
jgi:integrase